MERGENQNELRKLRINLEQKIKDNRKYHRNVKNYVQKSERENYKL